MSGKVKRRVKLLAGAAIPIAGLIATASTGGVPTAHALSYGDLNAIQKHILSGFAALSLQGESATKPPNNFYPRPSGGCPGNTSSNIKVNQNCLNLTDSDL